MAKKKKKKKVSKDDVFGIGVTYDFTTEDDWTKREKYRKAREKWLRDSVTRRDEKLDTIVSLLRRILKKVS